MPHFRATVMRDLQPGRDGFAESVARTYVLPFVIAAIASIGCCLLFGRASVYAAQAMNIASLLFLAISIGTFALSSYVWHRCSLETRRRLFLLLVLGTALPFLAFTSLALTSQHLSLVDTESIVVGRGFLRIEGATSYTLAEKLRRTLDASLPLDRVELQNTGGSVENAIAASDFLIGRGIGTAVATGDCASACAYMLLLFPRRYAVAHARLGFHDIASPDREALAVERARLTARLRDNGIPMYAITAFFSTTLLRWESTRQLAQEELIAGCWDAASASPTACPAS